MTLHCCAPRWIPVFDIRRIEKFVKVEAVTRTRNQAEKSTSTSDYARR
ncbi:hypothetical protein At1D1108_50730 (plasmid) [Agrobacterium tumefaciens]|nr:hypothetical protein At1D1108_50730 [Agrobacterium tumefaciens]